MGTGWIGLGQPAADDRHLAGPVSGLVRQEAPESGRQLGEIAIPYQSPLEPVWHGWLQRRRMLRPLTHFARWLAWHLRPTG